MKDEITQNNFIQIALKSYDNPQCITLGQFSKDVNKFSAVKKLLNGMLYGDSLESDSEYVRLTLNNIVYLYNVFENENCTKLLFFKVRQMHWYKLKTYLVFLGRMPEEIPEQHLKDSNLKICPQIAKHLRMI
jgi:hypothetical protein